MTNATDFDTSHDERNAIAQGLSQLLADTYILQLKTQNYHWNVTGPMFRALHMMFEEQYTELAAVIDEIAERIRALGFKAPGSFARFAELATVKEETGTPTANEMIARLLQDQQTIVRVAKSVMPATETIGDEPTAGLLSDRMDVHEKAAWMLRSMTE